MYDIEDEMKFIKNRDSDMALTITSDDEVYDIKEINTNSCEFETPYDWKYHIYIEANVGPSIIVGADFDDNTVILPESEENATQEPETKDDNEFYISMIIELNRYLLNDVGYDSMNIKDLDMNLDGKINVVDLAILKSLVK